MKFKIVTIIAFFFLAGGAFAQQPMIDLEFLDQEIRDILLVLGEIGGRSIIPDETVEGRATYRFSQMTIDQAFDVFLDAYGLQMEERNGVFYVSRVIIETTGPNTFSLNAQDVPLSGFIRVLGRRLNTTVLSDSLPNENITFRLEDTTIRNVLEIIATKYPDYFVNDENDILYLQRNSTRNATNVDPVEGLERTATGLYNLTSAQARVKALLGNLFEQEGAEYVFLSDRDQILEDINIIQKPFEAVLEILEIRANIEIVIESGVYYVLDATQETLQNLFKTTTVIPLRFLSAQDLFRLIPNTLSSGSQIKIDEMANTIIYTGRPGQVATFWEFLNQVDRPIENQSLFQYQLQHLTADEAVDILGQYFPSTRITRFENSRTLTFRAPDIRGREILRFMEEVDFRDMGIPYSTEYVSIDALESALPPYIQEDSIQFLEGTNHFFFTGGENQRMNLEHFLHYYDRPQPQIRYQVLVIQYNDDLGLDWKNEVSVSRTAEGIETPGADQNGTPFDADASVFAGNIGSLLGLNFDVVSTFGYSFGVDLTAQLTDSSADVLIDSVIRGLSGEQVSIQNTNTDRFRDTPEADPDTGETVSTGVIRELSSGFFLTIDGEVIGDNLINLTIDATLSKERETDSGEGSLPSTSEKKVNSQIRAIPGEPVVIGGLKQSDTTYTVTKVPLLGDIPFLGALFQFRTESVRESDLVIYIVPFLETVSNSDDRVSFRLEELYNRFF